MMKVDIKRTNKHKTCDEGVPTAHMDYEITMSSRHRGTPKSTHDYEIIFIQHFKETLYQPLYNKFLETAINVSV